MTISVTHTKVSSVPDGADTSLVRPSDWNASHTLSGVGSMAEQDASNVAITGGSVNGTSLGATTAASAKVTTLDIGSGLTLATSAGTAGQVLTSAGAGNVPTWSTNGAGDVVGPASSTDNAVARYDSTTGKLIQNSVVIVDDTGSVTGVNALTAESLVINNNATLGSSNTDTLEINARITTDLEPNADAAKDVGTSGRNWRDGFFSRNLQAEGKLVSPHFDALNSAGGQLRNSGGTPQLQWGGGGGNNISVDVATNLNPANAQIDISPTGTGTVRINPSTASSMNNVVIGASTPLAGTFTDLGVTGTLSFDSAQGSSGQVLTSQGSGVTPIWTTPTTGTVTSVSGTAPISSSGGATPAISISQATTSTDGYLSSTDWNTFNGKAPLVSPSFTTPVLGTPTSGNLSNCTVDGTNLIGYRNVPAVGTKTSSYSLTTSDVGKYVQVGSGGSITIPDATFAEGDIVSVFNNTSGNITITCSITTAYISGTDADKATMTLATRGVATILFISGTVCVVSGNVS